MSHKVDVNKMRSKVKIIRFGLTVGVKVDPSTSFSKLKFTPHNHLSKLAYKNDIIIPVEIHIAEGQLTTRFEMFCFRNDGVIVEANA